ncbi:MAG: acyl-CoA thioesterase [Trueperaceae bacterium]|nr:acyl-CoA thioesterase [Trueperaceae bacterium]
MSRRARVEIQVRFGDTDALGHINNATYATYAELGRVELVRDLGLPPGGFILARLALDYRRQVRLGQAVSVETWVERVGNSSVTMRQEILADGEVAVEVEAVAVWFDYAKNVPVRVPDDARRVFEEWRVGD